MIHCITATCRTHGLVCTFLHIPRLACLCHSVRGGLDRGLEQLPQMVHLVIGLLGLFLLLALQQANALAKSAQERLDGVKPGLCALLDLLIAVLDHLAK